MTRWFDEMSSFTEERWSSVLAAVKERPIPDGWTRVPVPAGAPRLR